MGLSNHLLVLFYLLSLSNHSSLTRDWTQALVVKMLSPNQWIARDFPELSILIEIWFVELLCNPLDCSPPGSSVHGFLKERTLERVALQFSRGSSWPRDQTHVSCIGRHILYLWATLGSPRDSILNDDCPHWACVSLKIGIALTIIERPQSTFLDLCHNP